MNKDVIKFTAKAFLAVAAVFTGKKLEKLGENALKDAKRIPSGNRNRQK